MKLLGWGLMLASWAITQGAHADSNWKFVTMSTDKSVWYVDLQSIKNINEGYGETPTKAWIKIDYSLVNSQVARELKQLIFFKCEAEQAKTLSYIKYKPDGSVMESYTFPAPSYQAVVPETVLQAAMEIVCSTRQ